jgi:hypothetical protein
MGAIEVIDGNQRQTPSPLARIVTASALLLLGAAFVRQATSQVGSGSAPRCTNPTPHDSAWWHWTWKANANEPSTGTVPDAPHQARGLDPAKWAGKYRLWMVHTVGPDRGDTVTATVQLTSGESSARGKPTRMGTAEATAPWPRYLSFAPTPETVSPLQRSIDVDYNQKTGELSFVLGNPHLAWTDSGVFLEVFTMSEGSFVGRWVDGGLLVFGDSTHTDEVHPQGYFCLLRTDSSAP